MIGKGEFHRENSIGLMPARHVTRWLNCASVSGLSGILLTGQRWLIVSLVTRPLSNIQCIATGAMVDERLVGSPFIILSLSRLRAPLSLCWIIVGPMSAQH